MTEVCSTITVMDDHGVLVSWAMRKLHIAAEEVDDARQGGAVGLLVALDRFDPTRGSFRGFAGSHVLAEVRAAVGWNRRLQVHLVELHDHQVAERVAQDDDALARVERADAIVATQQFIARLDAEEQRMVDLLYGEEWTQTAVAAELGVNKMAVSRKVAKIHAKARQALAGYANAAA